MAKLRRWAFAIGSLVALLLAGGAVWKIGGGPF
jgi:hypothetical protein